MCKNQLQAINAVYYGFLFRGVVGVNTPYFPPNPNSNPLEQMHKKPGVFDYQLYFQTPVSFLLLNVIFSYSVVHVIVDIFHGSMELDVYLN